MSCDCCHGKGLSERQRNEWWFLNNIHMGGCDQQITTCSKSLCLSVMHIKTMVIGFRFLAIAQLLGQSSKWQWGLCALRHGIQISMEAILACHPARCTEWLHCQPKSCELWRIGMGPITQYTSWSLLSHDVSARFPLPSSSSAGLLSDCHFELLLGFYMMNHSPPHSMHQLLGFYMINHSPPHSMHQLLRFYMMNHSPPHSMHQVLGFCMINHSPPHSMHQVLGFYMINHSPPHGMHQAVIHTGLIVRTCGRFHTVIFV